MLASFFIECSSPECLYRFCSQKIVRIFNQLTGNLVYLMFGFRKEIEMENGNIISDKELMSMGYNKATAQRIIKESRELLVERGFSFYDRKRLMIVPKTIVAEILGVQI